MQWKGSFSPRALGLGITLSRPSEPPLLSAAILVSAFDATRTEALGPLLAALPLFAGITFHGNSLFAVFKLRREVRPKGVFLYNCSEPVLESRLARRVGLQSAQHCLRLCYSFGSFFRAGILGCF